MQRKVPVLVLTLLFIFQTLAFTAAADSAPDMTVFDKTVVVEKIIYGSEQPGALTERVGKLEKDLYGVNTKEALVTKLDNIYNYMETTSAGAPSFIFKLNAAEWSLNHEVTVQPVRARLEGVERITTGVTPAGGYDSRLTKIINLTYPDGQVTVGNATLTKDTLIKIKLVSALGSKTSRPGDEVVYQAASDVLVDNQLVIPKGALGKGKVVKVEPARNFGRDAEIVLSFDTIQAMDGMEITTYLGDKAKEETKSLAKAAGASVAGMALLGPIGVVGGAFVHGSDVTIPAGTEMYIQTKDDATVCGLLTE